MSGHSKWAGIKHKKAIVDAKRGQAFTKVSAELSVSAREGGADPVGNFRLRLAIQKAREVNMPADNIERAIQRGAGGKDGVKLEEVRYEGYGPHGVAVMLDVLTDNRNRTVAAIRNLFTRSGGSLGESNSVAWMFSNQGIIRIEAGERDPEEIALELLDLLDVGADGDIERRRLVGPGVAGAPPLRGGAAAGGGGRLHGGGGRGDHEPGHLGHPRRPPGPAGPAPARRLEELDDVQQVYANAEIPDEVLESVTS
jgi:YebC/PmpR family DNA-binding regulatory protein